MKYLIFLLLFDLGFSLDLDSRREKIIEIIDEELNEVERLSKRSLRPDYLLRMAELNLEKARLYREKENQNFLAVPTSKRRKTNKSSYFKTSTKFFNEASRLARIITKKFKRYKNIADVYYILGFNAKESNRNKKATRYFSLATKKSRKNSKANIRSKISLAELYFNQSKYQKAARLYNSALSIHRDKWWTKDSFNLAWSYYRIGKKSLAIAKMKEIYSQSKSSKYVDMRAQVERDIGIMFATSGRVNEGISFYKKIDIDFAPMLVGIATSLKKQGKYSDANKVLLEALKFSKNRELQEQIYIEQLDLFAKYNRYQSHLNVAKKIYSIKDKVATSTLDRLLFHAKKEGAKLQKQVAAKTYKRLPKVRRQKANMAIEYFSIVANLSAKDRAEYLYLQGETARVIGKDLLSFEKYKETYSVKNSKFKLRAMNGMLTSLGSKRISKKFKNRNYASLYLSFIKDFPRDKRQKIIRQKLFKVYLDQNDYKNAKKTLDLYTKKFSQDYKTQEAMIGSLIEIDRKNKNYGAIKLWVAAADNKQYNISNKYRVKLKELLTSIQIDGVQGQLEKGNKKAALAGYLDVLKDPYATKKAKVNAKYNIAALYFELQDIEQSYKWSLESIKEMTPLQVKQFSSSFLTISNFYFMSFDFNKSISLSESLLDKMCRVSTQNKSLGFKNAAYLSIANDKLEKAESLILKAKKCKVYVSYINEVQFELLDTYLKQEQYPNAEKLADELSKKKSNRGLLISYLYEILKANEALGNNRVASRLKNKIYTYYREAKAKRFSFEVEDLDVISRFENQTLKSLGSSTDRIRLTFPEKVFNQNLKKMLQSLDKVTNKAISIQKIGSGEGIVSSYLTLIQTYKNAINKIKNFTPSGKSKNYINGFKKSMASLYGPLNKTLNTYIKNSKRSIFKNEILSSNNVKLLNIVLENNVQAVTNSRGVNMDRGGRL